MRFGFEGQFRPAGGISFDAAHTLNGGYAETTREHQHRAALQAVSHARDVGEGRTFLSMLGLYQTWGGDTSEMNARR